MKLNKIILFIKKINKIKQECTNISFTYIVNSVLKPIVSDQFWNFSCRIK